MSKPVNLNEERKYRNLKREAKKLKRELFVTFQNCPWYQKRPRRKSWEEFINGDKDE